MTKIFALIDCNSFYCSCERVFNPKLKDKPVVVLSNNDGCAIARTPEAKKLGIKMGTPAFMIKNDKIMSQAKLFSSNYTLYGDMSYRVQQVVAEFVKNFEIYSIDELFLELDGYEHLGIEEYAASIKDAVLMWTGIPTCIGIGPTKTLSKIANNIAKKDLSSNGVYSLMDKTKRDIVLNEFPVEDMWGIGQASAKKLENLGIRTAGQLRDMPPIQARKYGTVIAERTVFELNGISCVPLEEVPPLRKGIAVTRSFGKPVTDKNEMFEAISTHATRGAEKLRIHGVVSGKICVFMRTSKYRNTKQYYNKVIGNLNPFTQDTRPILERSIELAEKIYKEGIEFGKCGIFFHDLIPQNEKPIDLFNSEHQNSKELMSAIDKINNIHGKKSIRFARSPSFKNQSWKAISNKRSPRYTTRLNEVPIVLANDKYFNNS